MASNLEVYAATKRYVDMRVAELSGQIRNVEFDVSVNNDRYIVLRLEFADGQARSFELRHALPSLVGVFEPGRRYDALDVVFTDSGSWTATRNTESVPGTDDNWERTRVWGSDEIRAANSAWLKQINVALRRFTREKA